MFHFNKDSSTEEGDAIHRVLDWLNAGGPLAVVGACLGGERESGGGGGGGSYSVSWCVRPWIKLTLEYPFNENVNENSQSDPADEPSNQLKHVKLSSQTYILHYYYLQNFMHI